jgi:hypothetical protein
MRNDGGYMRMPGEVMIRKRVARSFGEAEHVDRRGRAIDTSRKRHPHRQSRVKRRAVDRTVGACGPGAAMRARGHQARLHPLAKDVRAREGDLERHVVCHLERVVGVGEETATRVDGA